MQKSYNPKSKSFKNTFCVFIEKSLAEIENLEVSYKSQSGSKYYYTPAGMYRWSNHWGRLANSKWRLIESEIEVQSIENESKFKLGYANFSDFLPDNNFDKLYFLEYNSNNQTINYQHKLSQINDVNAVLRTAGDTSKRIKQARNILNLTNWAKYFDYDNLNDLRLNIINELIYTEKSLEQIKKEIYGTQ